MSVNNLLDISDLSVLLDKKYILNKLNLKVGLGEVHVIMGPNGVGKSTLAKVLVGDRNNYSISGSVVYDNLDLFSLTPDEVSLKGMFLSFQHPLEIPGLSNFQFFKSFINSKRKYEKLEPINNKEFLFKVRKFMKILDMNEEFLHRSVNEGFSGGEKKKNEVLQMLLLDPKLVILDEIDSGLDIDSLKSVFKCIYSFITDKNSLLIITHYTRILNYIDVDFVHIMNNGCIVKTGDKSLALAVDKKGYSVV